MDHFAPFWANPITVIDFETTSPDPETCMPVQVAAVRFEGGKVVDTYSSLINPVIPIPAEATAIHGIRDKDVANAVYHWTAIRGSERLLKGALLCAYNADFDRAIFYRCGDWIVDGDPDPWIDPLVMVRHFDRWERGKGRHKLENACKRWGVEVGKAHDALEDAIATGKLLWAMKDKFDDVTYSELIRRQRLRAAEQQRDFDEWLAKQPPKEEA